MSTEQGYNGWANYSTWATALWIDNDPGLYEMRREMARAAILEEISAYSFGDRLKDVVVESMPEIGASLASDLLGYAVDLIDWREIATAWLVEERSEVEWEDDIDNSVIAAEIETAQADGFDVSSSASRQHWIETGEFLKAGEVEADAAAESERQLREETARHMRGLAAEEAGGSYALAAGDADPMDGVVTELHEIRASLVVYSLNDVQPILTAARERLAALANGLS